MQVMVLGAQGMIGRKFVRALVGGAIGPVSALTLVDVVQPDAPPGFAGRLRAMAMDLSADGAAERLVALRPDLIVHLAAIVSGEAERDFEKGYRINLDGTRNLLEAIRRVGGGYCPRLVFASSLAVFGAPLPEVVDDLHLVAPLTSYGTQKAISELLIDDYSRRGFLDGISLRLPTICIRPGPPNAAASGFFSGILREPLVGQPAILPVPDDVRHWHASPRAAVGFLCHAATLDTARLGHRRAVTMPGVSATVAEQIEALRAVAGSDAVALIRREPDPLIERIVRGWPQAFDAARATALGFRAETDFQDIIRVHIEDELTG
jgi:nucleoside-diphosphate-sugar epimerase